MKPDKVILIYRKTPTPVFLIIGLAFLGGLTIMFLEQCHIWSSDTKTFHFSKAAQTTGVDMIKFPPGNIETFDVITVHGSERYVYFFFGKNGYAILADKRINASRQTG